MVWMETGGRESVNSVPTQKSLALTAPDKLRKTAVTSECHPGLNEHTLNPV